MRWRETQGKPFASRVAARSVAFESRIWCGSGRAVGGRSSRPQVSTATRGRVWTSKRVLPTAAATAKCAGSNQVPTGNSSSPACASSPCWRIFAPGLIGPRISTSRSPTGRASSMMATLSAPMGTLAPVKMRTHSPAPIRHLGSVPAGTSPVTRSTVCPGPKSLARTAKPSMAERADAGKSRSAPNDSASTWPRDASRSHSDGAVA